jgi:putative MATE family efflux protein
VLNIVLDPLFIFGFGFIPRLGVNGAAWATVLARGIGSLVALEILLRGRSRVHVRMKYFRMDPATILGIFRIGIPATAQMSLRGLVNLVMFAVVAGFGTYALAAYGSGQRLFMLAMMPGFALGMASGTLVGQNLGAKQPERAALSAWTTVGYYAIFMFFMCVVFVFFAPYLIMLFNNNAAVVRIGSSFLRITALGTVFIAPGLILGRSMAGAGDTVSPMIITFISLWLVQIPLAIFLSRVLGIDGIWFAILTAYLVMAFMGVFWFQLGRWKHKRV